jgi:DNA-binding XRE family transcriptional regulator
MPKRSRSYSPQTRDAVEVLAAQIAVARRKRGWSAAALGERVGVSGPTITSLEKGSPAVAIGIAFEAATLLGIRLFGVEGPELSRLARQGRETLALLPSRVVARQEPVDDDF